MSQLLGESAKTLSVAAAAPGAFRLARMSSAFLRREGMPPFIALVPANVRLIRFAVAGAAAGRRGGHR